eukprot:scaffold18079_cov65-Phaeocystis_antarctica.AAC.10
MVIVAGAVQRCDVAAVWLVEGGVGGKGVRPLLFGWSMAAWAASSSRGVQRHTLAVALEACGVQGRGTAAVRLVDGGVGGEQQPHAVAAATEAGVY